MEAPAFTATLHIMILLYIGYTRASVLVPVAMIGAVGEDGSANIGTTAADSESGYIAQSKAPADCD